MEKMLIQTGEHKIEVELFDNETTQDIVAHLPLSLTMERYDDREFYAILDFHPSTNGMVIENYKNGDVIYFPKLNSFAIFYAKEGGDAIPGLILIGHVASELDVFSALDEKADCEISLA
jgi:hypothetical protein